MKRKQKTLLFILLLSMKVMFGYLQDTNLSFKQNKNRITEQ